MKRILPALLFALTALTAQAEGGGLRLPDLAGGSLSDSPAERGLRLRFLAPAHSLPADTLTPGREFGASYGRSSLRADWPVLGEGFRTVLGLSWASPARPTQSAPTALDITPFISLGWTTSNVAQRGWHLNAEVGTAIGGQRCAFSGCKDTFTGFDPHSSGSGLRLNPYVNFGATFTFGE
ncbi:MAG: hypothetical protein REI09_01195 [Candidatus Dactylopiibacterium sp.]|nr:hypothetical protein [Candidatus Dactylopiibacterium sp.]